MRLRAVREGTHHCEVRISEITRYERDERTSLDSVRTSNGGPDDDRVEAIQEYCYEHGVLVRTAGQYGNVVRLLPPLVLTQRQAEVGTEVIADAIEATPEQRRGSPTESAISEAPVSVRGSGAETKIGIRIAERAQRNTLQ